MKKQTALVAVILLLTSLGHPIAASPDSDETVVVAVGDSDSALLTANAIASEHGHTVLQVPVDGLEAKHKQLLTSRIEHGELRSAIVIGTDVDAVASDLRGVSLSIKNQITADSDRRLFYDATLQEWDSSETAFVTSTLNSDRQKISIALTHENLSAPVLEQSIGTSDLRSALHYLGVETVYVTPGVSDSTEEALNEDFTVRTDPEGVSLTDSLQRVASGLATDASRVAVTHPDQVHEAAQIGTSLLVTEGDGTLSDDANIQLQANTETTEVYTVGDVDVTEVTDATSASVIEIPEHAMLRMNVLASPYDYGLLVSEVEADDREYTIGITNIGFSEIPTIDGVSVTASWTGLIVDSDPSGEVVDQEYRVVNTDSMSPAETFTVELDVQQIDNGGHPSLDYYVETSSGGLIGVGDVSLNLPFVDYTPPAWLIVLGAATAATMVIGALHYAIILRRQ